ncbi:MAG: type III-B CRISPR module RAMP protein Cmr4 [Chloroflexota bacterium]
MFTARSMLFFCVETPLHAGTGRSLGTVDLPVQRERSTGYPIVQASSIKGRLRAETKSLINDDEKWLTIFGPEQEATEEGKRSSDFGGALSTGDARILLFPVRSLAGVFAWVTCVDVLARFQREAASIGLKLDDGNNGKFILPSEPDKNSATTINKNLWADGKNVVLEEFSFTGNEDPSLAPLATWLANHVLPSTAEYNYWRDHLADKLCILPENAFRDFVLYGTEVQTHIALDPATKTVKSGALWTAESLPVDSILYAPVQSTPPRKPGASLTDGTAILNAVKSTDLTRIHLGGDETTGQGIVALHFEGGA